MEEECRLTRHRCARGNGGVEIPHGMRCNGTTRVIEDRGLYPISKRLAQFTAADPVNPCGGGAA